MDASESTVVPAYCASPYKTGTTYLAGLYERTNRANHEPAHYCTLRNIDDVDFMRRRQSYFELQLESSGFFANRIELLRTIAPEAPILYLFRPFETWLRSFLNYFKQLGERVRYSYVARIVFDPITQWPVDQYSRLPYEAQAAVVHALANYWAECYEQALADTGHTLIVPLTQVDERLSEITQHLRLAPPATTNVWKRQSGGQSGVGPLPQLAPEQQDRVDRVSEAVARS